MANHTLSQLFDTNFIMVLEESNQAHLNFKGSTHSLDVFRNEAGSYQFDLYFDGKQVPWEIEWSEIVGLLPSFDNNMFRDVKIESDSLHVTKLFLRFSSGTFSLLNGKIEMWRINNAKAFQSELSKLDSVLCF